MKSSTPEQQLRPELEPLPRRLALLPLDARGYPVPWFVAWIDGQPEFRIADGEKWRRAVRESRCWMCGDRLGRYRTFVIGPMCAVNQTTAEPPCHTDCARYAARNCPFLTRPQMVRREDETVNPELFAREGAGEAILRNPGVTLLWTTRSFRIFRDVKGKPLIRIGPAEQVEWYAAGRPATRAEVAASIDSGLPLLREIAARESPDAIRALERQWAAVLPLYPRGDPMTDVAISKLVFDEACYPRVSRDSERVQQLADLLKGKTRLPPVLVERRTFLVLGGWHTVAAYRAHGATTVPAKLVTVAPADRLLYAYRQDVAAALPYRDVDVQKVARLEYERRRTNGGTVEQLAADLGRSRPTVQRWLADQLAREEERRLFERRVRTVVVQAFLADGASLRQIARYIGIARTTQVFRDAHVSIREHLADTRIVSAAQSQIHLALGQGATRQQVDAARDWLLSQTQPALLQTAALNNSLGRIDSDLARALDFLMQADAVEVPPFDTESSTQDRRAAILAAIETALVRLQSIRKKVCDEPGD